ncbi:MAG TPA: hypothetical protein VIO86_07090 [Candidatus Dormibacteraeota bacterium]
MSLGSRWRVRRWRPAHGLIAATAVIVAMAGTVATAAASTGFGPSQVQPWVVAPGSQREAQPGFGAVSSAVAYLDEPPTPLGGLLREPLKIRSF